LCVVCLVSLFCLCGVFLCFVFVVCVCVVCVVCVCVGCVVCGVCVVYVCVIGTPAPVRLDPPGHNLECHTSGHDHFCLTAR